MLPDILHFMQRVCHTGTDMTIDPSTKPGTSPSTKFGVNGYKQLAFVDTETTGTMPGKHELLEIGIVITEAEPPYKIQDTLNIMVKPERIEDAQPEALQVNHYNEAEWENALSEKEAMDQFTYKVRGCSIWGWLISFDRAFLEPAMNRAGHSLDSAGIDFLWYDLKVLFIQWAMLVNREDEFKPRFGLNTARKAFNIENEDAHRALSDAVTTYQMFTALEEEFLKLNAKLKQTTLAL